MPTDDMHTSGAESPPPRLIKSPQNLAAGLLLLILGGIGLLGTAGVSIGTPAEFGAGMVPRAVSILVAGCGLALVVLALARTGDAVGRWPVRALMCIVGAVATFGLTLRGFEFGPVGLPALGLLVSGPLAIVVAAAADPATRIGEILLFALVLTALCIGLFRFVLRLPIPIAPWLFGF